jgi:hypothetical protein
LGDEVAAGFTLGFDPSKLRNPVIGLGPDASSGTVLTTNVSKGGEGQLAILVDSSEVLSSNRLVAITFDVVGHAGEATSVTFTDAITKGGVSDVDGNLLPTRFVDASVSIPDSAMPAIEVSGRVLTANGQGLRNATVTLTDADGNVRFATTTSFGYYRFEEIAAGGTYTLRVESKRFHFEPRTIQINNSLTDFDFQAP